MKKIIFFILYISCFNAFAQDLQKLVKPIVEEGKTLYRSEMASWHGTDLFLEQYEDRSNIGGYFSYEEDNVIKCVFFSKETTPNVIGTIFFDSTFSHDKAVVYLEKRTFNKKEDQIFTLRQAALNEMKKDTIFKNYQDMNLNLIPLIGKKEHKVYVVTGPTKTGVVIFGNDYLLTFDKKNKLIQTKKLHKNIIPIGYGNTEEKVESTFHTHLSETGNLITATDVCTLMLYGKFTGWKQHNVISKKYYMSWDINKEELIIIPMETLRKINELQKEDAK